MCWLMADGIVDKHEKCHRNPPVFVGPRALHKLGIQYFYIPVENSEKGLSSVAMSRGYDYKDEVVITRETMADYDEWLKRFFEEHFHPEDAIRYVVEGNGYFDVRTPEDRWIRILGEPGDLLIIPAGIFHRFTDEIRYVIDGYGYFDVRNKDEKWIRILCEPGDLLILPAGIFHRFTLTKDDFIHVIRLFKGDPVWTAFNRTDKQSNSEFELTDLLEKVEIHKLASDWQNCLYLATLFYTENGRILCTVDDCLPVICVDENFTGNGLNPDEFHWLLKLSLCWNQLKQLQNALLSCNTASANCSIRIRLLEAASAMHNALGVKDIGRLHYVPLQPRPDNDVMLAAQGLALRWMRLSKFLIRRQGCSVMESLKHEMLPILNFYESSLISLKPGLYLAYLKLQSSLNCVNVLIPENFTSILPFAKIRSNNFLTQQEWMLLQSLNFNNNGIIIKKEKSEQQQQIFTEEQINFQKQLASAAKNTVEPLY
uniref:Probable inactive acireductone dioxygenase n=1 Tax=Meloidogyne incognita TaxID=6306 RepID=A0A914L9Y1_MELIC